MDVEKEILSLIPELLRSYDHRRKGVTIDVGVGTFNFYCKLFANLGYDTIAVEPLPSDEVMRLSKQYDIKLIEACLLDKNGEIEIYTGSFKDANCMDVSSVNKDWWGVTSKSKAKVVPTLTLESLIKRQNIQEITFFKIDTEGSEQAIIKQFTSLDTSLLPKIIEFEYGGGGKKQEAKGGWSDKYFSSTIDSIRTLADLGYKYVLLFERENDSPKDITLTEMNKLESIFEDNFVYGDILMFRECKYELRGGTLTFNSQETLFDKFKNIFK